MGTSVTPNIFDFLIKIDPFDKLPEPVVESIANCVRALGKMTNLVLLSSTHSKMPKMVTKRKRLKIHCSI